MKVDRRNFELPSHRLDHLVNESEARQGYGNEMIGTRRRRRRRPAIAVPQAFRGSFAHFSETSDDDSISGDDLEMEVHELAGSKRSRETEPRRHHRSGGSATDEEDLDESAFGAATASRTKHARTSAHPGLRNGGQELAYSNGDAAGGGECRKGEPLSGCENHPAPCHAGGRLLVDELEDGMTDDSDDAEAWNEGSECNGANHSDAEGDSDGDDELSSVGGGDGGAAGYSEVDAWLHDTDEWWSPDFANKQRDA
ncbi:hypothetical protein JKP88DRAFT_309079 [Tribonema minus]|uniref:Uncharacterized protein n=1 Tax=Tribonema minus TaxID=303371 RepID=A0A835Z877_9STRA|nr:hypothetical protein JKP88DRAFT_309079 [Tribonema minus]